MASIYETAETFGGSCSLAKPILLSITVPEVKKLRQPTKHYVYKIVVQWSDGTSTVIYRRYSMFFDIMVKLQELHSDLREKNPKFRGESGLQLPDLPGKVLFGRSEIHQVAEKRRVKIEEFCQFLVNLPPEMSQSSLVLGFFNTWPDDTIHRNLSHSQLPTADSQESSSKSSPTSPTSGAIISHPDEMENLEQYRAIADYQRKDSHQVDLKEGQVVHVIEKHDTGWWMVVTEDEQGYTPASYLEAVDKTYDTAVLEVQPDEDYEAMESFVPQSEDEIGFEVGEKVEVLHKKMDGWWKIRCKGRIGYCPATLIRKKIKELEAEEDSKDRMATILSEKNIYEGLNIHRPPPRRNTIKRNITRPTAIIGDPASLSTNHYKVPKPVTTGKKANVSSESVDKVVSPPFSPDHYEVAPCFEGEDALGNAPIYENTEFDTSTPESSHSLYENMAYNGHPKNSSPAMGHSLDDDPDNEYINPEEFTGELSPPIKRNSSDNSPAKSVSIRTPTTSTSASSFTSSTLSSSSLQPQAQNHHKQSPQQQPHGERQEHKRLTPSKSLGIVAHYSEMANDDEYIEMDPIYAPVAPDEPPEEPKASPQDKKKPRPPIPSPFKSKEKQLSIDSPPVAAVSSNIPRGRVLQRTKSLENLLSSSPEKGSHPLASRMPPAPGKVAGKTPPPPPQLSKPVLPPSSSSCQQPRTNSPPQSNGYDHIDGFPSHTANHVNAGGSSAVSPIFSKKPEPARRVAGKNLYKKVIVDAQSSPRSERSPPTASIPSPPHRPPDPFKPSFLPKTYVAIEDYASQAPGCLTFKSGDRCVLIKTSTGGWWFVNIGGREGWTPGEFWQEDHRQVMMASFAQPPSVAPQKLTPSKPRSHTVMAGGTDALPNADSSSEGNSTRSESFGSGTSDTSQSSVGGESHLGRLAKKVPPPKPRPIAATSSAGTPVRRFNFDVQEVHGSSPPPPPPPRRESSHSLLSGKQPAMDNSQEEYSLLTNATTAMPLEEMPWFVGTMDREKAEHFLMENGRQREFLVRERVAKPGYYALSIRYHYSVKHFNIDPRPEGFAMGIMQFPSIEEVVKHYQQNSLFVHDGQAVSLGQPVKRKSRGEIGRFVH